MNKTLPFSPADILVTKTNPKTWATIACDQYTSQIEYWNDVYKIVGDDPSCLNITLPEIFLDDKGNKKRIGAINDKMEEYLKEDIFTEYKNALILTERTVSTGDIRRGVIGKFALDDYSFNAGDKSLIRPTEGTVLSRIPPRVEIRKDAPLELPHIMILMDDKRREIIESLNTERMTPLYDFDLMMDGGHIKGFLIDEDQKRDLLYKLTVLMEECCGEGDGMLFAVGDGNHSLASAKESSALIGTDEAKYALAELVSIHSKGVGFQPIYRVLFNADTADVIKWAKEYFKSASGRKVAYITKDDEGEFFVDGLEADVLQKFIDLYIGEHPKCRVDYIHGAENVKKLAAEENTIGFIFEGMPKEELFPYVEKYGVLPRKTFSIGQADDKRFYLEARKIR